MSLSPTFGLVVVIAASTGVSGCSTSSSPQLHCASWPAQVLAAQSVPSAAYVPCLHDVPEPWILLSTDSDQDRTVVRLTWQDPAERSRNAEVSLRSACVSRGPRSPEIDDASADVVINQSADGDMTRTVYAFEGGCVQVDVPTDQLTPAGRSPFTVQLRPRAELDDYVREQTGGRVALDPQST